MSASRSRPLLLVPLLAAIACAPRLRPLAGVVPEVVRLPVTAIPRGHQRVVFDWELEDPDLVARGEGVARLAHPDSARLDFFVGGGMGAGVAILVGDDLRAPGPDMVRKLVPPAPLLWASLGRLAIPAERDTVARVDGGLLRADIGQPVRWRVSFRGDTLVRLERVDGGRMVEWVERTSPTSVRYRHEVARRELTLTVERRERSDPFDASIWRF
jgi:hypothetical protein